MARIDKPEPKPDRKFLTRSDLENLPPVDWIVEEVIPSAGLTLLFGDSEIGKSFLSLDLACRLATGKNFWFGGANAPHIAKSGPVLYLNAEGNRSAIRDRLFAWEAFNGERLPDAGVVLPGDTMPRIEIKELTKLLDDFEKAFGTNPVLVIIDTLNQAQVGDAGASSDIENSNATAGAMIHTLREVMGVQSGESDPRTSFLLVHHTGHQDKLRYRGASAIGAGADAIIGMAYFDPSKNGAKRFYRPSVDDILASTRKNAEPESPYRLAWCYKSKDSERWAPFAVEGVRAEFERLNPGPLDEKTGSSLAFRYRDLEALSDEIPLMGVKPNLVPTFQLIMDKGDFPGGSKRSVAEQLAPELGLAASTVRRHLDELEQLGKIEADQTGLYLSEPATERS